MQTESTRKSPLQMLLEQLAQSIATTLVGDSDYVKGMRKSLRDTESYVKSIAKEEALQLEQECIAFKEWCHLNEQELCFLAGRNLTTKELYQYYQNPNIKSHDKTRPS